MDWFLKISQREDIALTLRALLAAPRQMRQPYSLRPPALTLLTKEIFSYLIARVMPHSPNIHFSVLQALQFILLGWGDTRRKEIYSFALGG